ncbi:hypothetical protein LTS18_008737, partial [Coniosporium uncinatum]
MLRHPRCLATKLCYDRDYMIDIVAKDSPYTAKIIEANQIYADKWFTRLVDPYQYELSARSEAYWKKYSGSLSRAKTWIESPTPSMTGLSQ